MHFSARIGYVDIAGHSPAMGRQTSATVRGGENASVSLARWRYGCCNLR